jgi:lipid-binding SYLF domain-containing protein
MNRTLYSIIAGASLMTAALVAPAPSQASGMQDEVDQAAAIIERFREMPEQGIPDKVLKDAKGLAILTVL